MATNIDALKEAIESAGGTQTEFAVRLTEARGRRITQKSISKWICTGRVPLDWIIYIERVSGVPCHRLDPEHYPAQNAA